MRRKYPMKIEVSFRGLPGTGKSRLADELMSWLNRRGIEVEMLDEEQYSAMPHAEPEGYAFISVKQK